MQDKEAPRTITGEVGLIALKLTLLGLTFLANCVFFKPTVAIYYMIAVYIHELGHLIAVKSLRYKTTGIFFFPFLGAGVTLLEKIEDHAERVFLFSSGPIAGTLATLIFLAIGHHTNNRQLIAVAILNAFMNMVNLLPMPLLDGGWIYHSVKNSHYRRPWLQVRMDRWRTVGLVLSYFTPIWSTVFIQLLFSLLMKRITRHREEPAVPLNEEDIRLTIFGHWALTILLAFISFFWPWMSYVQAIRTAYRWFS